MQGQKIGKANKEGNLWSKKSCPYDIHAKIHICAAKMIPSFVVTSGKRLQKYGKLPFMGKSTVNGYFQ